MRARPVLRAVALLTTLAGLLAVPAASAAAPKSKVNAKATKKTVAKGSASTTSAAKSAGRSAAASKKSTSANSRSSKAGEGKVAYDPVLNSTSIPAAPAATAASTGAPPQRGPTRIDFDDRLIQGQTNKSGAVYLYDRKELRQRSMIKKRETFREEIVGAVYDSEL